MFKDKSISVLLIVLFCIGLFLGSYQEYWEQGARKVDTTNTNIVKKNDDIFVEVIWDASGSMWGRDLGVEKIIRSKEVLKTLTGKIPEKINLGLRIFGARKIGDLKDSFLAVPPDENSREDILNFITNVRPLGKSPIGYSLNQARKDLSRVEGKKYILLISDGIENGKLPASEIIDELKNEDIALHIVHLGEQENKELRARWKQLAESTGGKYFTYHNHQDVIATFQNIQ